jgi:hypothetical protein
MTPPGREIGAVHPLEDPLQRHLAVVEQRDQGVADLFQVMRWDVGRHADRDARDPVDQQVGELGRQHDRLVGRRRIVGPVVDRLLSQLAEEGVGDRRQAALGVTHRGRGIAVDRAEVTVAVHQRLPHAERLRHADQSIIDGLIAVRVVRLHHLADDRRALDVAPVGRDVQVVPHRIQDTTLHGLEAVADVGQGPRRDHAQGVIEIPAARGLGQRDVLDHGVRTPAATFPSPFALRHRSRPTSTPTRGRPDVPASTLIQTLKCPLSQSQFPDL